MSKHRLDHLSAKGLEMAQAAIALAAATGSVGTTYRCAGSYDHRGEPTNGENVFVKVERVSRHAAAWRIADASVDPLPGSVLVLSGLPGRYQVHGEA